MVKVVLPEAFLAFCGVLLLAGKNLYSELNCIDDNVQCAGLQKKRRKGRPSDVNNSEVFTPFLNSQT